MDIYNNNISRAIEAGELSVAQTLLDDTVAQTGESAVTLYLRGNIALKQSKWHEAISFFSQSESYDPNGPAREARHMLDDIMCFYNKDLYNP